MAFAIIALALWFAAISNFRRYWERYAVGRVGLILQVVALTLLVVGSLLYFNLRITAPLSPLMIISAGGAIAMLFIGIIFGIVGSILFGVMLLRLTKERGVDLGFRIAGISYVIGFMFLMILVIGIIGAILM